MKSMIILSYCDRCFHEGKSQVPADASFTVSISNSDSKPAPPRVIDVCQNHAAELDAVSALVAKLGVPPEGTLLTRPTKVAGPSADYKQWASAQPHSCPICGRERSNRNNLVEHIWRRHLSGGGRPKPSVCPECHWVPEDAAHPAMVVAQHRLRIHGFDALAEAVDLYQATPHAEPLVSDFAPRQQEQPPRPTNVCPGCGEDYYNRRDLANHIWTHHLDTPAPEPLTTCPTCDKPFPSAASQAAHRWRSHSESSLTDALAAFEKHQTKARTA